MRKKRGPALITSDQVREVHPVHRPLQHTIWSVFGLMAFHKSRWRVTNRVSSPLFQQNGEMMESELNEFVGYLKSQVEIFVNRMKSNSSRGRSISNDSSVQTLFMNVTMNHSTLLRYIHQQDDSRGTYMTFDLGKYLDKYNQSLAHLGPH